MSDLLQSDSGDVCVGDLPLQTPEGLHGFLTWLLIKASFHDLTPQDMRCLAQYVLVMDHLAKRIREEEEYQRYQAARAEPLTVRIVRSKTLPLPTETARKEAV